MSTPCKALIALATLVLGVIGIANAKDEGTGEEMTLQQLQELGAAATSAEALGIKPLRAQALQEAAVMVGAQGGLHIRSREIMVVIKRYGAQLDQIFDFRVLILRNNVLPPVIDEGRNLLNLDDSDNVREADITYKIQQQARFVTAVPRWQDYLAQEFPKPEHPHPTLLPANEQERRYWRTWVETGWKDGIAQAEAIFDINLSRLKRDYLGMVRYRTLVAQGIASAVHVAQTNLGVTGGGDEITINDRITRLTAKPALNVDAHRWQVTARDGTASIIGGSDDDADKSLSFSSDAAIPAKRTKAIKAIVVPEAVGNCSQ